MRLLLTLGETTTDVPVARAGDHLVLGRQAVLEATGWTAQDHGLCRGEVCLPARLGASLTLVELAALLDRPLAVEVDDEVSVAVLGETRGATSRAGELSPELTLADADGAPVTVTRRGRRTLVVAWSTWCGCRYELPAWKALGEELEPLGLDLVAVALDDDTDRVRHWSHKAGLPAVLDPDHRLSDLFGVVNVPSTVWLDEEGRVVKPPTIAPGDDRFQEFTEVEAQRHHAALRTWMSGGDPPADDRHGDEPDDDVRLARAEHRLATRLLAEDRPEAARRRFDAAVALAPLDFSIRRASMRHRGQNPFGEEFLALWQEWSAAGRPGYDPT